jgi:hypothetical protein
MVALAWNTHDTLAESYTGAARFLRDTKKLLSH